MTKHKFSRRSFLKSASVLPLVNFTPSFAASCNEGDRKSLVCVFLLGGADSFSFVVPSGQQYNDYLATRGNLAVTRDNLLAATDSTIGDFSFNSLLPGLHSSYQANNLAVINNVGNLVRPTSKADFNASTQLPQSLFAHNAQQKLWQTGSGNLTQSGGWGGSIAQYVANCNSTSNVSTSMSVNGSSTWLNNLVESYVSLNSNASIALMRGHQASSSTRTVLATLIEQAKANSATPFAQEVANGVERAIDTSNSLSVALTRHPLNDFSASGGFEAQLKLVARLISAREDLNMGKQIFFVGLGGWDTHSNQNERLTPLLRQLDTGLTKFQTAINRLGKANSVTTFTASDFGRSLTSNGDGTDHGWGGHAFVLGGAVDGGKVFGEFPSFRAINNPDDADDGGTFAGRIIPKLSVTQYSATLASWMGVTNVERDLMLPNLTNFSVKNLGFMQS